MKSPLAWKRAACVFLAVAVGYIARSQVNRPESEGLRLELEAVLATARMDDVAVAAELLCRALPPERFPDAASLLQEARPCVERRIAMEILLKHWARADGAGAYDFARGQDIVGRTDAESIALAGWAEREPSKAWHELMIVSRRAADPRYDVISVLEQVAATDLNLALRLYRDLVPDRACLQCAAAMLTVTAAREGQFKAMESAIATIPPGPSRDALIFGYWHYLGQYLPEWGLERLAGFTPDADTRAAETAFSGGWALSDFDGCLRHILSKSKAENFEELLLPAVGAWARDADSDDLVDLIQTLPRHLAQRSLLGLAALLVSVDAKVTMDWVASFPDSDVRTNSLDRAIRRWAKIDQAAAMKYIEQTEDVEVRGIMLWNYLLSSIANQTFLLEELEVIDESFDLEWRERLFSQVAAQLADPSISRSGRYDLAAFRRIVEEREDLSLEAKAKALAPFDRFHRR